MGISYEKKQRSFNLSVFIVKLYLWTANENEHIRSLIYSAVNIKLDCLWPHCECSGEDISVGHVLKSSLV